MVDCSNELEKFWDEKVKMPKGIYDKLIEKRNTQLDKIKTKIEKDDKVSLKIVDKVHQGSCRMKTLIQQDEEYDIDVGIVFDVKNLEDNSKTYSDTIKSYIVERLADKRFANSVEKKKNCIRIIYKDNFHIDMVIYKKDDDILYLATNNKWEESNPININKWFDEEKKNKQHLRKIVQFLKKWSKNQTKSMPSGLILTILASECYIDDSRLDTSFYKTMENIKNRLSKNSSVKIPNSDIEVTASQKHLKKVTNLFEIFEKLFDNILKDIDNNDKNKILNIWKNFFDDDYFDNFVKTMAVESMPSPWSKM